jgi:hypothetical protein
VPDSSPTAWSTYSWLGLVVLLSLLLTGYELFKMFDRDFGRALSNRFAWLLGLLNVVAAGAVWLIIHQVISVRPTLLSALVTGLTFPMLLRSRFTLYRSIGPAEAGDVDELSLKMDEIYHSLQRAFYREVNLQLAGARLALSQKIRQSFNADQLAIYLADFIAAERIEAERLAHGRQLEEIAAIEDQTVRHRQLAYLLLDLRTRPELERAIRARSLTPSRRRRGR